MVGSYILFLHGELIMKIVCKVQKRKYFTLIELWKEAAAMICDGNCDSDVKGKDNEVLI